jgi:hypothetical protein
MAGLALPTALRAQGQAAQSADTILYGVRAPGWAGHVTALSSNVLLGGLTAGILQELRGGSFKDGFSRGALGGVFTYAGKRVASRRFDGAGLLGRELAAVGSSVIRNASEARPAFDELMFTLGPLRLLARPGTRQLHASIDLVGAAWIAWGIAEPDLDLAVGESFSAGTAVFRTDNKVIVLNAGRTHGGGFTPASVVLLSHVPGWGSVFLERVAAHERVHVLQEDQMLHTWLEPLNELLVTRLPYDQRIARHTDLNWSAEMLGLLANLFARHADRPWELEAIYLSR